MNAFLRASGASAAAALTALLALFLAWHHPLSPALALLACVGLGAFTFMGPARWAYAVFPVLPVAGLMTWTGWLAAEELDFVVLAVAAGGYARLALGAARSTGSRRGLPGSWRWLLLIAAVTAMGLWRGLLDAGGDSFGWWQGYREPANSLRLAKGVFEALILLPLMQAAWREDQALASARMLSAFTWMLLVTAVAVVWERMAFTSLLDFSTDYRATGLFWEMHVGGAALDAVLAVGMPFAAAALAAARSPRAALVPAVALLLGTYACLATFSRIVYIAVPLALAGWWWLRVGGWAGVRRLARPGQAGRAPALVAALPALRAGEPAWPATAGLWPGLVWITGFALLAWWLFPVAGWRGMLALLGAVVVLLPLQGLRCRLAGAQLAAALAGGVLAVGAVALCAWLLPKGAYLAFAAAWSACVAAMVLVVRQGLPMAAVAALSSALAALAALPAVAWHWGGAAALGPAAGASAVLGGVLITSTLRSQPAWPGSLRWQAGLLGLLAVVAMLTGVFSGGAYMGGRMDKLAQDGTDRQQHWQKALNVLGDAEDWLLGKGLGRFPAQFALSSQAEEQTGDLRLQATAEGQVLLLSSGQHLLGNGALFRLSQRVSPLSAVSPAPGTTAATLRLAVRSAQDFNLMVEVCAKNLLYPWGCTNLHQDVAATASGAWQTLALALPGPAPDAGDWWAPRPMSFSLAINSRGRRIEIDRLSLVDASGRELLGNGSFEQGLAYWYTSSDRHHLPWHAKNAAVHLLVEQGLLGLLAWGVAAAVALWRLTLGAARRRSLAPPLAAALAGLAAVGAVDSLFDMPRVAFLGTWLLVLALALPGGRRLAGRGRAVRSPGRKSGRDSGGNSGVRGRRTRSPPTAVRA